MCIKDGPEGESLFTMTRTMVLGPRSPEFFRLKITWPSMRGSAAGSGFFSTGLTSATGLSGGSVGRSSGFTVFGSFGSTGKSVATIPRPGPGGDAARVARAISSGSW